MGFSFRPPERRVWKVRDLVASVRTHIEREFSDAWVEGEISNFRAPESGHLYFTLKDADSPPPLSHRHRDLSARRRSARYLEHPATPPSLGKRADLSRPGPG